jgi:hypothetical protein
MVLIGDYQQEREREREREIERERDVPLGVT